MHFRLTLSLLLFCSFSCNNNASSKNTDRNIASPAKVIHSKDNDFTQVKNIPLPQGYKRIQEAENSFAAWLENVALKKDKTVYKFDGKEKNNQSAQFAVLDISVGKKDLQQCADAVMRLRAEYLFAQQNFEQIIFRDNKSGVYTFTKPYNRENFLKYLDRVFGMCGTASLVKQLKPKNNFSDIKAGDVLIRGGFPGHAVIVMDVAENANGNRIYIIAQSYMPAQDIHILQNPTNKNLSPWYEVDEDDVIQTPEYTFSKNELMQW
jgi:hypothetical protein